ncbi:hypothetical protein GP486_006729 [Trichoglossum hirsutum]|uniref:Superoxide dismutase [Mn], mitochondrial n=1 Tax=Trichoglossum hirsutum TaxID=265104 RepID=A0A9P8ID63_9PEZI|nr:hypothetical protein GP486_006729 [Trichoglossum hirsutum]
MPCEGSEAHGSKHVLKAIMPLGIERINARRRSPNDRIVFIKPLDGPDKALAQDFLERVAAVCHPIMKANHLAVMSLEEYEPNMEFVGRNFNAGEVIQLVLKAPYSGHWLPFRHVQMVMMHELAHCKQMNHSKAFWKVRNQYCDELRLLWQRNYTGDGFWSRGQTLLSGQYTTSSLPSDEVLPRSLCGGTYRSSHKRKRKRNQENSSLSYAERQQRRIARKFGTQGVALGEDQDSRAVLEDGKKTKGKPKVAGSARGRELRAAAALRRFESQKINDQLKSGDEGISSDSGSDGGYDGPEIKEEAVDRDGRKMMDSKGRGMIQVCKSEEDTTECDDMRREMRELQEVDQNKDGLLATDGADFRGRSTDQGCTTVRSETETEDLSIRRGPNIEVPATAKVSSSLSPQGAEGSAPRKPSADTTFGSEKNARKRPPETFLIADTGSQLCSNKRPKSPVGTTDCPVCSMSNDTSSLTLKSSVASREWKIDSGGPPLLLTKPPLSSYGDALDLLEQVGGPTASGVLGYIKPKQPTPRTTMQLATYFLQLPQLLLNLTQPSSSPSPGIPRQDEVATSAAVIEDIVMTTKYTLPPLPYKYDALEPYISGQIMTIHHTKHHQTYVNNLNAALETLATYKQATDIPAHIALQQAIKFNGGGHINHSLFWENLTPAGSHGASESAGPQVRKAIKERWGSEDGFKKSFSAVLLGLQGSGWGWLVRDEEFGSLEIITTKDQDPVPAGKVPIFGVDMWEHAYYLQYLNNKAEYVKGIWHVINWDTAEKRYLGGRKDAFSVLKASM